MLSMQEMKVQLLKPVRQLSKIKTLFNLTQTFDEYKAAVALTKSISKDQDAVLSKIITFCEVRTLFPDWYKAIAYSFKKSMKEGQHPQNWLANQLQKLGIYKASEGFQGKHIPNHHCMSFMFDLLYGTQRSDMCQLKSDDDSFDFDRRMRHYLSEAKSQTPLKQDNITRGDLIVYSIGSSKSTYTHVAIFVGTANNQLYAVSKFGTSFPVFFHPITGDISENYGNPIFFKLQPILSLAPTLEEKFAELQTELSLHLPKTVKEKASASDSKNEEKEIQHPEQTTGNFQITPLIYASLFAEWTAKNLPSDLTREMKLQIEDTRQKFIRK